MVGKKKEKKEVAPKVSAREKVEERREEVLSKGRKYKYPLQFAKHRVVLLTVVIAVFAIIMLTVMGWLALYKNQTTSDIFYRITQVLPVSVATVDGEKVRYSDYLMIYRSTITPMEQQQGQLGNDADSDMMRNYYKRQALTMAENYTYAVKLAKELGVEVTDEEVSAAVDVHRAAGGVERSEESFQRILQDNFAMSMNEYRRMVYLSLVQQKVSEAIDDEAKQVAQEVDALIKNGKSLSAIAKKLGNKVMYEETGGLVDEMNIDGGRAAVALKLKKGQTSEKFLASSGKGYYYVRLVEKNGAQVSYESIEIPFNAFAKKVKEMREQGKVDEKIEVEETDMSGQEGNNGKGADALEGK